VTDAIENGELVLASGRTIRLLALRQWAIYGGLLEGLPTRKINASIIASARTDARERDGNEPHLIEPVQTSIDYDGRYPFGEPARLPRIGCVGTFVSSGRDPVHVTCLTVIWFQDGYAFPLSSEAATAIRALDWETLAAQHEL
jgi:hypothetical protein